MKITPLVMLAAQRIPALTNTFSDVVPVATMAVAQGGVVTLTCSAPHGVPVGLQMGVSITDAYEPNPITAWSQYNAAVVGTGIIAGDVQITTQYPHTLSLSPDATKFDPWDSFAQITGTGVTGLDGNVMLVAVIDQYHFVVRPNGSITLPGTIQPAAALLQKMERTLIGWHNATAVDETTLTLPTPATITRSYNVANPVVVTNIRIWGGVDLANCLSKFSRLSQSQEVLAGLVLDRGYLFVTPKRDIRLSRDRRSLSNATTQIQPGAFVRQELMDGFEIYAILPAERYGGAVGCLDRCHGQVLTAVLRTFNGLKLPFTEFSSPNPFTTMLSGHRTAAYDKANYVHNYSFDATIYIGDADSAQQIEVPDLYALDAAIQNGTTPPPNLPPQGTVPIEAIIFNPGIFQEGKPQPLLATVPVDIQP